MKSDTIPQLAMLLESEYGIVRPSIESPEEGLESNTLIVTADKEKYVAKIYNDYRQAETLAQYQDALHTSGVPVPAIIMTQAGKPASGFDRQYVVLCEFAHGQPIGWREVFAMMPHQLSAEIAKAMATMHAVAPYAASPSKLDHALSVSNTLGIFENHIPEPLSPQNLAQTRQAMIHGDLTRENVLVNDPTPSVEAIIDFGDAHYDYITYDIAIALTQIYVTKSWGIDFRGIEDFLKVYTGQHVLTEIERQTILPLMILRNKALLQEIGSQLVQDSDDRETLESIKQSLQAKLKLLQEDNLKLNKLITDK